MDRAEGSREWEGYGESMLPLLVSGVGAPDFRIAAQDWLKGERQDTEDRNCRAGPARQAIESLAIFFNILILSGSDSAGRRGP